MKKFILLVLISSFCGFGKMFAQGEISAGMSLFVGKNGNYGLELIPIPTKVSLGFGDNTNLELGYSLYYMSGMNVKELPFEMDSSPFNPFFSHNFSLGLEQEIKMSGWRIDIEGGVFWALNNNSGIDKGNMDRALRSWLNTAPDLYSYEYETETIKGFYGGVKIIVDISSSMGIYISGRYIEGRGGMSLSAQSESIEERSFEFDDQYVDYTGIDFSVGVVLYGK